MFPELVVKEAEALRKTATPEEISKLNFEELIPSYYTDCIYGQMTGDCFSDRASELINACCEKLVSTHNVTLGDRYSEANAESGLVRGVKGTHFSPIELFIADEKNAMQEHYNKKLISYLKGEIDSLN